MMYTVCMKSFAVVKAFVVHGMPMEICTEAPNVLW